MRSHATFKRTLAVEGGGQTSIMEGLRTEETVRKWDENNSQFCWRMRNTLE